MLLTGQFSHKPTRDQSCRGLVNSPTANFKKITFIEWLFTPNFSSNVSASWLYHELTSPQLGWPRIELSTNSPVIVTLKGCDTIYFNNKLKTNTCRACCIVSKRHIADTVCVAVRAPSTIVAVFLYLIWPVARNRTRTLGSTPSNHAGNMFHRNAHFISVAHPIKREQIEMTNRSH